MRKQYGFFSFDKRVPLTPLSKQKAAFDLGPRAEASSSYQHDRGVQRAKATHMRHEDGKAKSKAEIVRKEATKAGNREIRALSVSILLRNGGYLVIARRISQIADRRGFTSALALAVLAKSDSRGRCHEKTLKQAQLGDK